jgi:hypothetical protein
MRLPSTRFNSILFVAAGLVAAAAVAGASPLAAQQYVVDDAAIVDRGACQVEAWHGRRASWILPACQAVRNLELAAGAGFIDTGDGRRETEYAVEAKTLFRPLATNDWGLGLVLGVGPNPSAAAGERHLADVYAFLPASLSLRDDQWTLHGNAGWEWNRDEGGGHGLTWGLRADLGLSPSFSLIGELFGEGGDRPEYQAGVRLHLPAAGVEADLSWGGHTDGRLRGAGVTIGAQFVSGRIF